MLLNIIIVSGGTVHSEYSLTIGTMYSVYSRPITFRYKHILSAAKWARKQSLTVIISKFVF